MINLKSKIYVAGHKGLVGSAILRKLKKKGYKNLILRSKKQLDLKNQNSCTPKPMADHLLSLLYTLRDKPDVLLKEITNFL